jgi:hypothetical protein
MRHLLCLIFISFLTSCAYAQDENTDLSTLQKGLLIESSNTLIPWKSRLSDKASIGRPKINRASDKNIEADWNIATILNGVFEILWRPTYQLYCTIYFFGSKFSVLKNHFF